MTLLEKKTATKICHVCELERVFGSFIYFRGSPPQAVESNICSSCNRELRQIDSYCSKVLEGTYIPFYEKPVKKYSITLTGFTK